MYWFEPVVSLEINIMSSFPSSFMSPTSILMWIGLEMVIAVSDQEFTPSVQLPNNTVRLPGLTNVSPTNLIFSW